MSLISNPTFQYITIIGVAIITLIVAIIALRKNGKKAISMKIVYPIELLSFKEGITDKLKVTYDGNEVENVSVSTFQFINTGNLTIEKSDFEEPIKMNLDSNVRILNAEISDTNPQNLKLKMTFSPSVVTLNPDFLNAKDSFTLKLITDKSFEKFYLDYRIIGVSEIKSATVPSHEFKVLRASFVFMILSFFGGALAYLFTQNNLFLAIFVIGFISFIFITGYIGYFILRDIYNFLRKRKIFFIKKNP